ncbi:MAG TPA: HAMP domain-containing protein [Spirochaetota bacterium]|nr:HAMP domain-containing protein [Spirochaetota bacterium]
MKRRPYFWSIFPAFVFITFVSGLLIIIFSVQTFEQIYTDFIYEKMIDESKLVQAVIDRTDSTETVKLDSIITSFASVLSSRITIIGENGTVLADSREKAPEMENHLDRPEVQKALRGETGRSVRFSSTLKKELMYTAMPVFTSNGNKYIVRTAFPLMSFSDTIRFFEKKIFLIVILVITLLAAVSLYLSKRLSSPLIRLKDKAKKIALGNFKQDIEDYPHYETNQLSESMNFMAAELEDKISHLNSRTASSPRY